MPYALKYVYRMSINLLLTTIYQMHNLSHTHFLFWNINSPLSETWHITPKAWSVMKHFRNWLSERKCFFIRQNKDSQAISTMTTVTTNCKARPPTFLCWSVLHRPANSPQSGWRGAGTCLTLTTVVPRSRFEYLLVEVAEQQWCPSGSSYLPEKGNNRSKTCLFVM